MNRLPDFVSEAEEERVAADRTTRFRRCRTGWEDVVFEVEDDQNPEFAPAPARP